jgi:hypothetical protein
MGEIMEENRFSSAKCCMINSEGYNGDLLLGVVVFSEVVLHILTGDDDASRGIMDISERSVYILLFDEWYTYRNVLWELGMKC